ncbi:MAG TPA: metallophosphoesterase [Planctomycetota bacterium]|nr:metallophosphoesterase [Planctomycetota bacterium]
MLPYLRLQLVYLTASALLALAVWWLWGRSARVRASPRLRIGATAVSLGLAWVAGAAAALILGRAHFSSRFSMVAFGFYWAAVCLPLVGLAAALGRRSAKPDWPLALAAVVLLAGGAWALFVEPNRLQVDELTLRFPAWPNPAPPLRVVHVSDLQTVGSCERESRAAELINAFHPDLIVITGDYIAGPFGDPEPAIAAARAFLGSLRARLGIVCVSGHSETEALRGRVLEGLDVHYLQNEELELDLSGAGGPRRLRIFGAPAHGLDLSRFDVRREPGLVTIFVSHVPDVSWDLIGLGVDLHLAGHTHGGQIVVPGFGPPVILSQLPRSLARGLHPFGDHWLNVNPGIGMEGHHAPRIRFLCPPEIDCILLAGGGAPFEPRPPPSRRKRMFR